MRRISWMLIFLVGFSIFALGAHAGINDGLVAYYPFNGNANDESGNGNNGTVNGPILTTDRFGNPNSAYDFDGTDDYIIASDSDSLDVSGPITISSWIKTNNTNIANAVINKLGLGDNNRNGYCTYVSDYSLSGKFYINLNNDWPVEACSVSSNSIVNDGNWHHVVGVYDGSNIKIYLDGFMDGNKICSIDIAINEHPLKIGWDPHDYENRFFNGKIDDIRIYNRALTEAEIQTLFSLNPSNVTFSAQKIISLDAQSPQSVVASDLYNDGDKDVISASYADNKIAFYENVGLGVFGFQSVISENATGAYSVYASDLDGDGDEDILFAAAGGKLGWLQNLGDGHFSTEKIIDDFGIIPYHAIAEDIYGDGDKDVIAASHYDDKILLYKNNGDSTFGTAQVVSSTADGAYHVFAADLDGDGDKDILSASSVDDKIAWYENLGSGTFSAEKVISTTANGATCVYGADLDNDGDVDVLSASGFDDQIAWYENDGTGVFSAEKVISSTMDGAYVVITGDLDKDGDQDVIAASKYDRKIAWFENLGGTFGPEKIIDTLAEGPTSVFAADLDNDSDLDIIISSQTDNTIAWYENQLSGEVDTDGDGTPDSSDGCPTDPLKTAPGLCGCNVTDSNTDTDNDGQVDCVDTDDDGDGLSDAEEAILGTNPLSTDTDGDGFSDAEEVNYGTDPKNSESHLTLNDGLVAHYPFNGNANDASGNGNNGTEYGGVIYVSGIAGQAISLDGIDDFIRVPDSEPLRLSNTDFTINAWVYENSRDVSYSDAILYKRETGTNNGWILSITGELNANNAGIGHLLYRVSVGEDPYISSIKELELSSWHNISILYESGSSTAKIYIDGILDCVKTNIPSPNPNTVSDLCIGKDSSNLYEYYFDGLIDEIRIFNRALNETEIQELYTQNAPTVDTPNDLSVSYNSDNNYNWITWANNGAASYNLYWGTESGVTKDSEFAGNTTNAVFSHTGVLPGWTYYYRVAAVDALGNESELSEEKSVLVPADLDNGLVAYYPFNGNANDASGNGNDGTENGGLVYVNGVDGQAASFDGIDDYVEKSNPNEKLNIGNDDWSVFAWIKSGDPLIRQTVVSRYECGWDCPGGGVSAALYQLKIRDGILRSRIRDDLATGPYDNMYILDGDQNLCDNLWHNIGFIINRAKSTFDIFVDGQIVNSFPIENLSEINDSGSPLSIGRTFIQDWGLPQQYFKGNIDDVRIYNRALTATEIQTLYNQVDIPTDSDGDGVPDDQDQCKDDPNKSEPGFCGCGNSELDTNTDGEPDCIDDDDDGDGMLDEFELLYSGCLDPLVTDGDGDCDGDGLTNFEEFYYGFNPTDQNSKPFSYLEFIENIGLAFEYASSSYVNESSLYSVVNNCINIPNYSYTDKNNVELISSDDSNQIRYYALQNQQYGYVEINDSFYASSYIDYTWNNDIVNDISNDNRFNTVYKVPENELTDFDQFEVISCVDDFPQPNFSTINRKSYYFTYDSMTDIPYGEAIGVDDWINYLKAITVHYNHKIDTLTIAAHGNGNLLLQNPKIVMSENFTFINPSLFADDALTKDAFERLKNENILSENATILIFACYVGSGPEGREFIQDIANWSGACVYANSDSSGGGEVKIIGSISLKRDWDLDVVKCPDQLISVTNLQAPIYSSHQTKIILDGGITIDANSGTFTNDGIVEVSNVTNDLSTNGINIDGYDALSAFDISIINAEIIDPNLITIGIPYNSTQSNNGLSVQYWDEGASQWTTEGIYNVEFDYDGNHVKFDTTHNSIFAVLQDLNEVDNDQDGFTENQGDCDDSINAIYPGAEEIPYDGIDQNCDGSDLTDVDEDGFDSTEAGGSDCNDNDAAINPDAIEICDSIDNNCNDLIDDGVYIFGNFEQPINTDGSSIFKVGRTVPVKISVSDCGGMNISTATLMISLVKVSDEILGSYEEVVIDSTDASNDGSYFRYDDTDQHYIYNLGTKNLSVGTYRIKVTAENGQSATVQISLK